MRRVLVGVDLTEREGPLLERVAELFAGGGTEVVLVHVAAPDPDFVGYEAGPDVVRDQRAEALREEHVRLQRMADALAERGCDATSRLVQGPTVETLLDLAREREAALLAVGATNKSRIEEAVLGSVSRALVRAGEVPVLVVPLPD